MIHDPADERLHRKTRILSTVAAVVIALAAGTNVSPPIPSPLLPF